MNASTHTEIQAIANAAPLETAAPATLLILVPLSQLRRSPERNVRKTGGLSIEDIAASIDRVGLLQNLCVIAPDDDGFYSVVAGGRRLTALQLLAKRKRIARDWQVPCLLVADGSARTVSLVENVQREAMHPADQFDAFAALVAEGRPVEVIAADFGVTPLLVQRRLKLANLAARLIADYRAGSVTLEQLMALAITDDHAAQQAAYYDAPEWQRDPDALRDRLTEREIAASHAMARFVGMDAYEAAGGGVRRDLFAEDDAGVYLTDASLLQMLAVDKLADHAAQIRREGWSWADATPTTTFADLQAFRRAPRERRAPTQQEADRIEKIEARMDEIDTEVDQAVDTDDEEKADALQEEGERLRDELHALEEELQEYSEATRKMAGAIITLNRSGEIVVHRGLLRQADAKALRASDKTQRGRHATGGDARGEGEAAGANSAAEISDRLAQRLSAHRTASLQIEVARHPHVALAALVHGMVQQVVHNSYFHHGLPLSVRVSTHDHLEGIAPDWSASPAVLAQLELRQTWARKLPEDSAELFAALLAMSQDELVQLLAVCTAATVGVVVNRATVAHPGEAIAEAVGLDMGNWWKPTAESYFAHLSKAAILDAVTAFAPDEVARLGKLKKSELAREAERLVQGTDWMPQVFRARAESEHAQHTDSEQVVNAVVSEPVEVMR
jgi:ParB family chromosome partitioning protein